MSLDFRRRCEPQTRVGPCFYAHNWTIGLMPPQSDGPLERPRIGNLNQATSSSRIGFHGSRSSGWLFGMLPRSISVDKAVCKSCRSPSLGSTRSSFFQFAKMQIHLFSRHPLQPTRLRPPCAPGASIRRTRLLPLHHRLVERRAAAGQFSDFVEYRCFQFYGRLVTSHLITTMQLLKARL
jgi:hypothetical protein